MGVGGERELAYQQQAAAGVGKRAIHAAGGVGEYAITEQPFEHASRLCFSIVGLNGNQRQQTSVYTADRFAIDLDAGRKYALDQGNHGGTGEGGAASLKRPRDLRKHGLPCRPTTAMTVHPLP